VTDHVAPVSIIDTHAHLDDEAFDHDRDAVIAASWAAGVTSIINIGYRPASWEASRILRERYERIEIAIGLHPQQADAYRPGFDEVLLDAIRTVRSVAVGETGFDFSRRNPTFEAQRRAFQGQIEVSICERLPLVIHQRDASDELIAELDRWPEVASIVLHSFDGNRRLTEWAIDRGCYFGIGGLATRGSAEGLRDLLRRVPLDRLLLETDAPYLAPPTAPSRRNTPANLPIIAAVLAPLWKVSAAELCTRTSATAIGVFGQRLRADHGTGTTDSSEDTARVGVAQDENGRSTEYYRMG
jgi:TatD DNase family protein